VPSLSLLDDATLLGIVGDSANLFWPSGSAVYRRGTPADGLYIVLSGAVSVRGADGEEVTALGPGDFFGEFSLLADSPHGHDVFAVGDCELMVVPKEPFDELLAANPALEASLRARAEERRAAAEERD
jgi:CPA1 family monovalent cation:H+ antiporter